MYPYIALADETLITYSHTKEEAGVNIIDVHFERPTEGGFDSVRCRLPDYKWTIWEGNYSDAEIAMFEKILKDSEEFILKYSKNAELIFGYK
jgi:hypothetical protein